MLTWTDIALGGLVLISLLLGIWISHKLPARSPWSIAEALFYLLLLALAILFAGAMITAALGLNGARAFAVWCVAFVFTLGHMIGTGTMVQFPPNKKDTAIPPETISEHPENEEVSTRL